MFTSSIAGGSQGRLDGVGSGRRIVVGKVSSAKCRRQGVVAEVFAADVGTRALPWEWPIIGRELRLMVIDCEQPPQFTRCVPSRECARERLRSNMR